MEQKDCAEEALILSGCSRGMQMNTECPLRSPLHAIPPQPRQRTAERHPHIASEPQTHQGGVTPGAVSSRGRMARGSASWGQARLYKYGMLLHHIMVNYYYCMHMVYCINMVYIYTVPVQRSSDLQLDVVTSRSNYS